MAKKDQPVITVRTRIKNYGIGTKKLELDICKLTTNQVSKISRLITDKEEVDVSISLVQLKLDLKDQDQNPNNKG